MVSLLEILIPTLEMFSYFYWDFLSVIFGLVTLWMSSVCWFQMYFFNCTYHSSVYPDNYTNATKKHIAPLSVVTTCQWRVSGVRIEQQDICSEEQRKYLVRKRVYPVICEIHQWQSWRKDFLHCPFVYQAPDLGSQSLCFVRVSRPRHRNGLGWERGWDRSSIW